MANTYTLISSVTVGSGGAANITFTSIPQTYTDLHLVVSARSADAVFLRGTSLRFNSNSSSSQYSYRELYGFNTSAGSFLETGIGQAFIGQIPGTSGTASTFGNTSIYIPNYTLSNSKSFSVDSTTEINSSSNWQNDLLANLWSETTAISSIYLLPSTGNYAQYSSAYLYGISNA
jgi:hypothetical protein